LDLFGGTATVSFLLKRMGKVVSDATNETEVSPANRKALKSYFA
jgi:hypothetical protein